MLPVRSLTPILRQLHFPVGLLLPAVRTIKTNFKLRIKQIKVKKKKANRESNRSLRRRDPYRYIFRPTEGRPKERLQAQRPNDWNQRGKRSKLGNQDDRQERRERRSLSPEDPKVSTLVDKALAKYDIAPRERKHSSLVRKEKKKKTLGRGKKGKMGNERSMNVVDTLGLVAHKPLSEAVKQQSGIPVPSAGKHDSRPQGEKRYLMRHARSEGLADLSTITYRSIDGTEIERKAPSNNWTYAKRKFKIHVIHEDKTMVVVNKPPAILSQPGLLGEGTIIDLLERDHPHLMPLQTVNRYAFTTGKRTDRRLDKNTSGVMILGRNVEIIPRLNGFFRDGEIEKNVRPTLPSECTLILQYLALIKPKPGTPLYSPSLSACPRMTITKESPTLIRGTFIKLAYLKRGFDRTQKQVIPEHGKVVVYQTRDHETSGYILSHHPSINESRITHFQQLLRLESAGKVLVLFTPLTGRRHQLRLHSAFLLGAPVVGDHRYGYPDNIGRTQPRIDDDVHKDGYALHCYRMAYNRPDSEDLAFDFTADLPELKSWGAIWDCVRAHTREPGFRDMIRLVSRKAGECFEQYEVKKIQRDPKGWVKSVESAWKNQVGKR